MPEAVTGGAGMFQVCWGGIAVETAEGGGKERNVSGRLCPKLRSEWSIREVGISSLDQHILAKHVKKTGKGIFVLTDS